MVLQRVATRTTNDFGKAAGERDRIIRDVAEVEPRLRAGATAEIDTRAPLGEVAERLEAISAGRPVGRAREGARVEGRGPAGAHPRAGAR